MNWFDWLLLAVATWRLSYLLTGETGPFLFAQRLRELRPLTGVLSCIYCASVWVAAALWSVYQYEQLQPIVWILAISGAALMLRNYTGVGMHGE